MRRRRTGADLAGLVHHSDRGVQYRAVRYTERLDEAAAVASVGSKGDSYDNALAESFFATLKRELIGERPWPSRVTARSAIFEWIEGWYNIRRLHSSLGYRSPATYEAALAA